MNCSNCGTENEVGQKFCDACGAALLLACPTCGASNRPGARFCRECATPFAPAAAPSGIAQRSPAASAWAPVAERRVVSILFADLVGFTTLAEGRDAEETRELLSRYFDLATEVIGRYGGSVEKFIGDAVMAVWGAPAAHEDDAERAVRAGLELVDAVRSLGPSISARAGVLTGEAAVTIGASNQGMVAGDLVNTASRLQSVAQPGTVLVGEATQRAASKAVAFEQAGEQILKGKTAPVMAWRALRIIAELGGRGRSETLEAPFVGRDDELRMLKDLFHATTREHRARLVSVIGPAGIGKSRLAWEFSKYTDGVVETTYWHTGRSPAYGEGISFWALGEMVRRRAGLLETDGEATTRAKIAESVGRWVPDPEERRWVEASLLALLGIESMTGGSEQLFGAWRTFFERIAAEGTVTMVFEDFHYADSGLIDFVDHVMEWSRTSPIYVVTLARPELLEKRPDWGAGKRNFVSLYLEPLSSVAMGELLAGLVPGLPESAVRAIVARADGVPLYAVETVRMLLAEGKLALEEGVYRPVGDLTNLAVPETLTALIASRLDGLDPADRALVADAAVLGQSFTLAGLSAVSGIPESELEPRLRALVRRELLTRESDPRSPEHGQYAFVQALIREVAYNTLAKRDRKARHLAAARFFESLDTDEVAGGLAGHYLAAQANAAEGPEADALATQARIALRAAAERAAELGSQRQAQGFYEQALTVTTEPVEIAELLGHAGEAASAGGRYEAAEAHLRGAISARRDLADRRAIASATGALGRSLIEAYQTPDAIAVLEPAAEEFADLSSDPEQVALLGQLARAYLLLDDNRKAIELADRVLEAAEHGDYQAVLADTLVTRGTALGSIGRPIEGLAAIRAGKDIAESLGSGNVILRAINNLAYLEGARDPRAALEHSRAGLALARRLGARVWLSGFLPNFGEFGLRTGDWSAAEEELLASLTEDWEPVDRNWLLIALLPITAARGETIDAPMAEARSLLTQSGDVQQPSSLLMTEGLVGLAVGDLADARDAFHRATSLYSPLLPTSAPRAARCALWLGDGAAAAADLEELEGSGFHGPAIEADRRTIQAGLAALSGRPAEALPLYREALRAWRDLGLAWDEALCGIDMATLLDPTDPEVRSAADSCREILIRLGAKPLLARLEAAIGRQRSAPSPEPARSRDPSTV